MIGRIPRGMKTNDSLHDPSSKGQALLRECVQAERCAHCCAVRHYHKHSVCTVAPRTDTSTSRGYPRTQRTTHLTPNSPTHAHALHARRSLSLSHSWSLLSLNVNTSARPPLPATRFLPAPCRNAPRFTALPPCPAHMVSCRRQGGGLGYAEPRIGKV